MKTTLAASLAMVLGITMGCSSNEWDEQAMQGDDEPMSRGGPRDDATRLQEDPVCGRTVSPWESDSEVYDGQTYYFHNEDCAKKFHDNPKAFLPGHEARDDRDVRADGMVKDPVCGHEVNARDAKWTEEYDHKKYYFDSKECAQKFKDNPHAYMPGGDDRPGVKEVK